MKIRLELKCFKHFFKNMGENGVSMIQVMIATAAMGGLSLLFADLMQKQALGKQKADFDYNVSLLKNQLEKLSKGNYCEVNFKYMMKGQNMNCFAIPKNSDVLSEENCFIKVKSPTSSGEWGNTGVIVTGMKILTPTEESNTDVSAEERASNAPPESRGLRKLSQAFDQTTGRGIAFLKVTVESKTRTYGGGVKPIIIPVDVHFKNIIETDFTDTVSGVCSSIPSSDPRMQTCQTLFQQKVREQIVSDINNGFAAIQTSNNISIPSISASNLFEIEECMQNSNLNSQRKLCFKMPEFNFLIEMQKKTISDQQSFVNSNPDKLKGDEASANPPESSLDPVYFYSYDPSQNRRTVNTTAYVTLDDQMPIQGCVNQ